MNLRIDVTPSQVESALESYLAASTDDPDLLALARKHRALPFWRDFGGALLLRPDGSILASDWERPGHIKPLTDRRPHRDLLHAARGWAAREYPLIEGLAPRRPPTAVPCPACDGTGVIPSLGDRYPNLLCACGGLGWLPNAPAPMNRSTHQSSWERFKAVARQLPARLFLWWNTPSK